MPTGPIVSMRRSPGSRVARALVRAGTSGASIPRAVWRKHGVTLDATAFQSAAFQHASRAAAAVAAIASRRGSTTASGLGTGVGVGSRNEEVSLAGVGEGVGGGGARQGIAAPGVAAAPG